MEFFGLVGEKLGHSLSPEIHHKIFSLLNIEGAYKLFEVERDDLGKFAESLKVLKIKGSNVTIPYKEDIMKYLDFISPEAKKINAVNTIVLKENKLYGYNTDYFGFGTIINKNEVELKDKTTMVLGTGGASKAVINYLLDNEVKEVYLVSRTKKAVSEYEDLRVKNVIYEEIKNITGDVLVNTTPVGMYPKVDNSPVGEDIISNFSTLIDIIYNPRLTKFLSMGQKLNKKICGGLEMLVGQAIKAEELWQNRAIDDDVLEKVYNDINEKFK